MKKFKTLLPNLGASCVNRDRPSVQRGRALAALLALLTLAPAAPLAVKAPVSVEVQLEALRDYDNLLAAIAYRLATTNVSLCDQTMPATGAVLHARSQYPAKLEVPVLALFGFSSPLAIETIVADSPAARSGLFANDGVLGVQALLPQMADGKPGTALRDDFEDRLVMLSPNVPQVWRVLRGGAEHSVTVHPVPACRARFEIVPGSKLTARSNGRLIQLSARYFAGFTAEELAVVVAHELAHNVLAHRRRLAAAGVSKGLLAEFGRSGRLNRQVEREADRLSVHLLRNAGYDPVLAVRFWEKRGKQLGSGGTHDSPLKRAQLLREEIATIPADAPIPYLPPLLALRDQPLT